MKLGRLWGAGPASVIAGSSATGERPGCPGEQLSSPWAGQGCAGGTPEMPQRGKCRLGAGSTAARSEAGADGGSGSVGGAGR